MKSIIIAVLITTLVCLASWMHVTYLDHYVKQAWSDGYNQKMLERLPAPDVWVDGRE